MALDDSTEGVRHDAALPPTSWTAAPVRQSALETWLTVNYFCYPTRENYLVTLQPCGINTVAIFPTGVLQATEDQNGEAACLAV